MQFSEVRLYWTTLIGIVVAKLDRSKATCKVKIFTPIPTPLIDVYTQERDDIFSIHSVGVKCMHSHKPRQANLGVFAEKTSGNLRGSSAKCTCPGYLVYREGEPCLDRSHPLIVIFRLCDTCNPNDDLFITRFVRSDVDASLGFFRGFVSPWIKTRQLDVKSGRVSW